MTSYLTKYYTEDAQKYSFLMLAFSAALLAVSYIYLINSSVMNTVIREQNNKEISRMIMKIGNLENSYMAKKSDLNIDKAYTLGYKDDFSRVHFSSENTNVSGNLSLLGNEF